MKKLIYWSLAAVLFAALAGCTAYDKNEAPRMESHVTLGR